MKRLLLALLFIAMPAFARDDGGISSGGDDPTRWLVCRTDLGDGVLLLFGFSNAGPRGVGSQQVIEFSKIRGEKKFAKTKVKMDSSTDLDFQSGELVLSMWGKRRSYEYKVEIFPKPEERGSYFYYKARLYSRDPFFGSREEYLVICKTYTQKAEPGSDGVDI